MLVKELINALQQMPQEKSITCQVITEDGAVWNCDFDVTDIKHSWMVNIKVSHSQLKKILDK